MNIHSPDMDNMPERDEAEAALSVLRRWAKQASETEILELDPSVANLLPGGAQDYPALERSYPDAFTVDQAYKDSLPDLQNGPSSLIKGSKQQIQHVGISNFSDFTPVTTVI